MVLRTSVRPEGRFQVAIHRPSYTVANMRANQQVDQLGRLDDGTPVTNHDNFPAGQVDVPESAEVFEIANPFPFRGATYISKEWADARRDDVASIRLPTPPAISMMQWIRQTIDPASSSSSSAEEMLISMPEPVQLALAVNSTDPEDLVLLAEAACEFIHDPHTGKPAGLRYLSAQDGAARPAVKNHALFEAVANNSYLPDSYKEVMVLRPGAQGNSEIVGAQRLNGNSHVFEYLRRNSYIPWGHYAANMANDAVRYRPETLTMTDMSAMRHLYYQRTYVRLAETLGMTGAETQDALAPSDLEALRLRIHKRLTGDERSDMLPFNGVLWGWNFGFDYAPSHYRLHASHQQVHQQYALIPKEALTLETAPGREETLPTYACGDQVDDFIRHYYQKTGVPFFSAYIAAIRNNQRTDGRTDGDPSLVVYEDEHVMLFVPKAQTSQWELQLLALRPVGNILEADAAIRSSLDKAMLIAIQTLGKMGARLITTIEYSKRFDAGATGQHLLYCFLPRLPQSPGAFSEAQHRWIIGHYPEDFAKACRANLPLLAEH